MRNPVTGPDVSVQDMFAQSTAVLTRPSPATFERYERSGGLQSAFIYVMLAAAVSGVIAAVFSFLHSDVSFFGQLFSRLISVPVGFLMFTGAVYLIGRTLFRGTGTYPEVAYTFALFYVPISIAMTLIGIIPVLGWLVSFALSLVLIYFGFLAVQSSMNLRDQTQAAVTLVLAWIAQAVVTGLIALFFGTLFAVGRAVTGG
ncbi:YIP1 family protein [Deinococcus knuensis]|uniref:YIP1 family protein n=1 Tax=Deinococcus knuensis TaxID=1837380 RepID=A0ABQ2SCH4_9DEIO|nr:YIP1 family protein [Deinococcus knuensis]GGS20016.1 YIP1 family protein [Deinococcus knuensis]